MISIPLYVTLGISAMDNAQGKKVILEFLRRHPWL